MDEELTTVTKEILERTEYLKKSTLNSMTVGDTYIVKGITIFEEVLKAINPMQVDDKLTGQIKKLINEYLHNKSSKHGNYIRYGIFNCYLILENYKKEYIFRKKYK